MNKLKIFFPILFIFLSCFNKKLQNSKDCVAINILELKNKNVLKNFINKVDSLKEIQELSADSIYFIDVNEAKLNRFFLEFDSNEFVKNNFFIKSYIIKNGPVTDSLRISIEFYPFECGFRLSILSKIFVKETNIINESAVIYSFQIINREIINFNRMLSG